METLMHSINNLRMMEVIDITSGTKLGFIKDIKIDCEEYKIISIILPLQKVGWFNKNNSIEIPWEHVRKIGLDVILVDGDNLPLEDD